MKTIFSTLMVTLFSAAALAQDITTVNAASGEISDNLDLRAVASIFGDAANLEDFERKLNDPALQISNLDLNGDNQVDYLRVVESVEGRTHLIILQSVLARDVYQDVATIEVERDGNNNVQVQVVGDVYMYGPNYIYEPVYVHRPVIFTTFWVSHYRPYCSTWYWGYYPTYFYAWHPYPVFRYRNNVHVHINTHHHYNYVNVRRSQRAVAMYSTRRSDGYARQHPTRSFQQRNASVANRYELDQRRNTRNATVKNGLLASNSSAVRQAGTPTGNNTRNNGAIRSNAGTRETTTAVPRQGNVQTRDNQNAGVRNTRQQSFSTRDNAPAAGNNAIRTRDHQSTRTMPSAAGSNWSTRASSAAGSARMESASARTPRAETPVRNQRTEPAQRAPRMESATRAQRMEPARTGQARAQSSPGNGRAERGSESRR